MNALFSKLDTVVPSREDATRAAASSRILASNPRESELHIRLEDGQEVVLPEAATRLLSYLLMEMGKGNAVTMMPMHAEVSTQEAADFLNVSRPYLVKQLENKKIPFHKAGSHRRVRVTDLVAYRKKIDEASAQALDELAAEAQALNMGY